MLACESLLAAVLREPQKLAELQPFQWDLLLPQARRAGMIARLARLAEQHGVRIAGRPGEYLDGASVVARRQAQAVHYEIERIGSALDGTGIPLILLKGAAYEMAGLPCAAGRTYTDIDILVPRQQVETAEKALRFHGWGNAHLSPYDQRYYRKWMHEVPPLQHIKRMTVIDLHHAILPLTARIPTDPTPLFESTQALSGHKDIYVLSPTDMVLHSATHLFSEGEYDHGLRDLADLDALLRHFSRMPGFWQKLAERAQRLNLTRFLYYALRYCRAVLDTPVPEGLTKQGRPLFPWAMDLLFGRALAPPHESCSDAMTGMARLSLYVRGHWLRMPLHLLVPHLFYKAFLADREEEEKEAKKAGV